jgi:hypothetical protein
MIVNKMIVNNRRQIPGKLGKSATAALILGDTGVTESSPFPLTGAVT